MYATDLEHLAHLQIHDRTLAARRLHRRRSLRRVAAARARRLEDALGR